MARTWQNHWLLFLITFFDPVHSQQSPPSSFTSLAEAFPPLQALEQTPLDRSPPIGRQNFTQCCLQAVSESYIILNGEVVNKPNTDNPFIRLSPLDLNATQFPCGASYKGKDEGAPEVRVPYSWCYQNCGGWQRSSNAALSEWVQPFVGFILPSAVFCLHVPRKFVLAISDGFFSNDFKVLPNKWSDFYQPLKALLASLTGAVLSILYGKKRKGSATTEQPQTKKDLGGKLIDVATNFGALCVFVFISTISTVIRASIAASIALVNTILWVAVVFSAATPMILSGLYEASLDRNVIKDMRRSLMDAEAWRGKSVTQRKEDIAGKRENDTEKGHYEERVHQLYAILIGNLILPNTEETRAGFDTDAESNTVWEDVQSLVERKKVKATEKSANPENSQQPEYAESLAQHKEVTATRLKGMLGCQASFGAAVGAPIVFFIGSFLFSVISNLSVVGDNNTSHALAFGMWWMTIPHVAIVSGCLLAGNNPNTLEVIVCGAIEPRHQNQKVKREGSRKWYQQFYETAYTPVWMLERGRNKQKWIKKVSEAYPERGDLAEDSTKRLRAFRLDFLDWVEIGLITVVLIVLPFVLAFLTSFYTPRIGLACRTFTFLLYFLFQLCYSLLWLWDFFTPKDLTRHVDWLPGGKKTNEMGEAIGKNAPTLYCILLSFVALGSGFTAVVGTFLQIVGVYRNCLCALPIQYWRSKDSWLVLSSNSALAIHLANNFWLPTGVSSIVLLILTCYGGWWYQRHWRQQFVEVVDQLCEEHNDVTDDDGTPDAKAFDKTRSKEPSVTEQEVDQIEEATPIPPSDSISKGPVATAVETVSDEEMSGGLTVTEREKDKVTT